MLVSFLHTNDFHGRLTEGAANSLLKLRPSADFYFDTGDVLRSMNILPSLAEDPSWGRLAHLGCTAGVPGNRDVSIIESLHRAKLRGLQHPLLCANVTDRAGNIPPILRPHLILHHNGLKIGLFGVMTRLVIPKPDSNAAIDLSWLAAYLWSNPIQAAKTQVQLLKSEECDVIIALTHIGFTQDRLLAETIPDIDIILGGHSHTVLQHPEILNGVAICQGGSSGQYVGVYQWDSDAKKLTGGLRPLITKTT